MNVNVNIESINWIFDSNQHQQQVQKWRNCERERERNRREMKRCKYLACRKFNDASYQCRFFSLVLSLPSRCYWTGYMPLIYLICVDLKRVSFWLVGVGVVGTALPVLGFVECWFFWGAKSMDFDKRRKWTSNQNQNGIAHYFWWITSIRMF